MEMHPYQTYAWKTPLSGGSSASKKALAGKAEASHLYSFKQNYYKRSTNVAEFEQALKGLLDSSKAKFTDKAGFESFVRSRLESLFDFSDPEIKKYMKMLF